MNNEVFAEQAVHLSRKNKAAVETSIQCGCYFCLRTFNSNTISEWADDGLGSTALCPTCDMDAVVPETEMTGKLTVEKLKAAHVRWFTRASTIELP